MDAQKYMIAANTTHNEFFTSSSSYDKPAWMALNEATVYHSIEIAEQAKQKLIKNGSYGVVVVLLSEMITKVTMDEKLKKSGTRHYAPAHAAHRDNFTDETDKDGYAKDTEDRTDPKVAAVAKVKAPDAAKIEDGKRLTEATFTMPPTPASNPIDTAPPSLIPNLKATPIIQYNDPYNIEDKDNKLGNPISGELDDKVSIPAEIITSLKDAVKEFDECAKSEDYSNDDRASFCKTVAGALDSIIKDLERGTNGGIKSAQVRMTSFMSPITNHIPPNVINFLARGGRKSNLKDLFNQIKNTAS